MVYDLVPAIENYRKLGFTTEPGGVHQGGLTHNALIALSDGGYLELFAPTRRWLPHALAVTRRLGLGKAGFGGKSPMQRRFLHHLATGEGFADFALHTTAMDETVTAARERGLEIEGPFAGGRALPDGREISWRLAAPRSPEVPFLIEDLTPREFRVPAGERCVHANQVKGVAGVTVAVKDLDASVARYRALLGSDPLRPAGGAAGEVSFRVGSSTITLTTSAGNRRDTANRPAARGGVPYLLRLHSAAGAKSGRLDETLTHRAIIEVSTA